MDRRSLQAQDLVAADESDQRQDGKHEDRREKQEWIKHAVQLLAKVRWSVRNAPHDTRVIELDDRRPDRHTVGA